MIATLSHSPVPVDTAATSMRPIIVGSDGSESAALAMKTAAMLSRATGSPVQVVSVLAPVSAIAPAPLLAGLPPDIDEVRAADRLDEVREQKSAAGGDRSWSVEVKFGDAATVLTRLAKERDGRLLVMGLNRHGAMDRVLRSDTVFDAVRMGEVPVFVANEAMVRPPRVIVIGVDFSALSTRAAQLAVNLFPEATDVYLVHVAPAIDVTSDGWRTVPVATRIASDFAAIVRSLDGCNARIHTVDLSGSCERELARFALGLDADLLVLGSYCRGLLRRLARGTVATRILRAATCPVLIVPEAAGAPDLGVEPERRADSRAEIRDRVAEVTRRNAGRRVVVEVDSPAIGAQALAFDYSFLGIDYDHHGDRVHIYLGEMMDGGSRHITHSVSHPTAVDVLPALDGRDQVVRIADGPGQVLVTFW